MSELNPVESTEDLLSEDFKSFLGSRYGSSPAVSASVDEEILRLAKSHLPQKESGGSVGRWNVLFWVRAAAASSMVAAGLGSVMVLNQYALQEDGSAVADRSGAPGMRAPDLVVRNEPRSAEDFDRSGRVDILDAFAVARMIRDGRNLDLRSDVNSDGRVDLEDVDLIANKAVAL